ncbi:hypothetical protein HYFRA_00004791 [Hymenoscyphus fraxineus]|uniref:BTB domain-containing protein n=1 Tax=Hymenoscyphus fraxineus TaxID=746836 RepID=A0A9N9KK68_9HELO|nr:hypothetical protein HYFRA_00004791 [Hymenoscyphus fraxineus]
MNDEYAPLQKLQTSTSIPQLNISFGLSRPSELSKSPRRILLHKPLAETHIFDDDGDVTLIFKKKKDEEKTRNGSHVEKEDTNDDPSQDSDSSPDSDYVESGDESESGEENDNHERESLPSRDPREAPPRVEFVKIQIIVSSKHLRLASPVFKAMSKPGFREGGALHPGAFYIVMAILHAYADDILWDSEIQELFELATVVHKNELLEAVVSLSWNWTTFDIIVLLN